MVFQVNAIYLLRLQLQSTYFITIRAHEGAYQTSLQSKLNAWVFVQNNFHVDRQSNCNSFFIHGLRTDASERVEAWLMMRTAVSDAFMVAVLQSIAVSIWQFCYNKHIIEFNVVLFLFSFYHSSHPRTPFAGGNAIAAECLCPRIVQYSSRHRISRGEAGQIMSLF